MSTKQDQNSLVNRDRRSLEEELAKFLSPERYEHSLQVEQAAIRLAKQYGASQDVAAIAGLLHDIARGLPPEKMLEQAGALNVPIEDIEKAEPGLLHAKVSAAIAAGSFGVCDPEILSAIRKHTFGSENMSLLEKIIYLADHVEMERKYPGVEEARELAFSNIDAAIIKVLELTLDYVKKKGGAVHPQTLKTLEWYKKYGNKSE